MSELQTILFDAKGPNDPLKCYKVGHMGCVGIKEKLHGLDEGGLVMASYIACFEDGEEIEVVDAHYISDDSPVIESESFVPDPGIALGLESRGQAIS